MEVLMFIMGKKTRPRSSDILVLLALIAAAAISLGAVLPGLVAKQSRVFYQEDIESEVKKKYPDVKKSFDDFKAAEKTIREKLACIDAALLDAAVADGKYDLARLQSEKQAYLNELARARSPISVQPFYQHVIMYFWPIMYFCLGTLIFVLRPPSVTGLTATERLWEVAILSLIVFMLDAGLLVLRNVWFSDTLSGRTVY